MMPDHGPTGNIRIRHSIQNMNTNTAAVVDGIIYMINQKIISCSSAKRKKETVFKKEGVMSEMHILCRRSCTIETCFIDFSLSF